MQVINASIRVEIPDDADSDVAESAIADCYLEGKIVRALREEGIEISAEDVAIDVNAD